MIWSNCGSCLCSALRMRLGPTGGGWVPHHFGPDVGLWTVLVERNPPTSLDLLVSSRLLPSFASDGEERDGNGNGSGNGKESGAAAEPGVIGLRRHRHHRPPPPLLPLLSLLRPRAPPHRPPRPRPQPTPEPKTSPFLSPLLLRRRLP